MPSGNIGYRLIMSATPLWLETTGAGRVQNPAYRASGQIKNATIWLRFFIHVYIYLIYPERMLDTKFANICLDFANESIRQPGSDGYQLSVKCSNVIGFIRP